MATVVIQNSGLYVEEENRGGESEVGGEKVRVSGDICILSLYRAVRGVGANHSWDEVENLSGCGKVKWAAMARQKNGRGESGEKMTI